MSKNPFIRFGLQAAFFIAVCTLTFFAVQRWGSKTAEKPRGDTIESVKGLTEGETVTLPELSDLKGGTVRLSTTDQKYVLLAFFNSSCPGCVIDSDLWKDLSAEGPKRNVAFYLVNVGDNQETVKKFVAAYKLDSLPVLFDLQQKVGPSLKINFVPQYVLLSAGGRVIKRWDGVRNYDKQKGMEQLNKFFDPTHGERF
jgi:peroxiredoxin